MPTDTLAFPYDSKTFYEGLVVRSPYNTWVKSQAKRFRWQENHDYTIVSGSDTSGGRPYRLYYLSYPAMLLLSEHYFFTGIGKSTYYALVRTEQQSAATA